jgi:hypothetical protein
MEDNSNNYTKILFRYYSDVLDEEVVETMWAEIIDKAKGIYKLDSIPFYGPSIATDDLFLAQYDEDENYIVYKETIEYSGNSIIQVVILKDGFDKEIIQERLKLIDCLSEGLNKKYFSVEITKNINYSVVKTLLNEYKNSDIIDYAEPYLSEKHRNDLLK